MQLIQPDLGLVFWMVLTFGLLVLILRKFGWPVILKTLKDREEQINKALNAAEMAKQEMEDIQIKNQQILQEVKEERDGILRDARLTSEKIIEEAHQRADLEAGRIVEIARQSINYEKLQAMTELKNQVAYLSIDIAEKILKQELSNDDAVQKILDEQIKKMTLN